MHKNNVVHAGIWNSIGTFLLKGIVFLSVPIFSRLLTPSDYGLVSTYSTYISFFTIIVGLSLNTALTNARIDYADNFKDYCNSIVSASGIIFVIQLIIFNFLVLKTGQILGISQLMLNFILFASYVDFLIRTYYGINMVDYKYRENLKISLSNAVISIVVSVILIKLMPDKVLARLIGQTLFLVLLIPYVLHSLAGGHSFNMRIEHVKYSIRIAIPNIFHQISQIIISQSDRVMILNIVSAESAGKYSLVYTYSLVMQMVWNAINDVWVPWLFRQLAINDILKIRRCSYIYMAGFSFLTVFVMLVAPDLLIYLAPSTYNDAKTLIIPLIFATYCLFLYSFFVNIEFYYKKNTFIAFATGLASAINIIGNIIFLPVYGYEIAAYTTALSYFFLFVFHAVLVLYFFRIKVYLLRYFFLCLLIIFGISCIAMALLNNVFLRYIVLAVIFGSCCLYGLKYKKELKELIEILKR